MSWPGGTWRLLILWSCCFDSTWQTTSVRHTKFTCMLIYKQSVQFYVTSFAQLYN